MTPIILKLPDMRIFDTLCLALLAALASPAKNVTVTLLATTDMHGNLLPYDFYTARPVPRGLAKIATLVEQVRRENPNTVLIDCGDTIQGTPLESVYQQYVRTNKLPLGLRPPAPLQGDPMMRAMNYLKYEAMVLGNHEFNFGLKNLDQARAQARFPYLSANTTVEPGAGKPFDRYIVRRIAGLNVAIVGVTTPGIPMWEEPDHIRGYRFLPGKEAVASAVAEVRSNYHPDIVIVAGHAGLGRDLKTGAPEGGELGGENMMYDVAAGVPGIDAIVFGHTHGQLASGTVGGVLVMQPKNWAISLGRMDFTLDDASGRWQIVKKTSTLIPVADSTPADPHLVQMAQPYFKAAEEYLNARVAEAAKPLSSEFARVRDTAIIDAIQQVQLEDAKADVSFTAAFNVRVNVPKGPVTVREIAALYLYENTLLAIEGNGRMVREALENAARYYLPCEGDCSHANLINPRIPGFNFDIAQGVEYEIDLSQPAGHRIRNLRWRGKPLSDSQPLRIAVNNYRAGGSGGYTMFRGAKVLWRSTREIRDLIVDYYIARKSMPSEPDNNWRIEPAAARTALEREAAEGDHRNQTK
jgi:2',3'-cyclic-nucleotide 2'-phosphodiesterase (5'-nucleotidase family)